MEDVGIFYKRLIHFTVFYYILWIFGIVCGNLVYFSPFWYFVPRKIWQPWLQRRRCKNLYRNIQPSPYFKKEEEELLQLLKKLQPTPTQVL
jgi:hypothetical protein